jgi:hypothetical protein
MDCVLPLASSCPLHSTQRKLDALCARIGQSVQDKTLLTQAVTSVFAHDTANNRKLAAYGVD